MAYFGPLQGFPVARVITRTVDARTLVFMVDEWKWLALYNLLSRLVLPSALLLVPLSMLVAEVSMTAADLRSEAAKALGQPW